MTFRTTFLSWVLALGSATFFISCAPTIRVETPEPVKIDVHMQVDVRTKDDSVKVKVSPEEEAPVSLRRRNRMGEIQTLKNARFIGEGKSGYLGIVKLPTGKLETGEDYADYTRRLIQQENSDRRALYLQNADKKGDSLELIEREYARRWQDISYPGEWIEKPDGTWYAK